MITTINTKTTNVLIVGVGGQGILTLSDLLSQAAANAGLDVKKSEVHGMAQRGGSVNSHVRFGPIVYSPLIEEKTADLLVALEKLEALRYINFLNPVTGVLIVNDERVDPLPVFSGQLPYPETVLDKCRDYTKNLHVINGKEEVKALNNPRLISTLMAGVVSAFLDIEESYWVDAINTRFPEKWREINKQALLRGRNSIKL